jgi:hypothetical protein
MICVLSCQIGKQGRGRHTVGGSRELGAGSVEKSLRMRHKVGGRAVTGGGWREKQRDEGGNLRPEVGNQEIRLRFFTALPAPRSALLKLRAAYGRRGNGNSVGRCVGKKGRSNAWRVTGGESRRRPEVRCRKAEVQRLATKSSMVIPMSFAI